MQDAASTAGDAILELRCRLVALNHLLPALPADLADEMAHTAPAAGPPPPAIRDIHKPVKMLLTQVRAFVLSATDTYMQYPWCCLCKYFLLQLLGHAPSA